MGRSGLVRQCAWAPVVLWVRKTFPDVNRITTAELAHRIASEAAPVLLDTRTSSEFGVSHLPGARWFDDESIETEVARRWSRDEPIVTYCSIGYRSAAVARRLSTLGYRDVRNLEGSIFQWANQGGQVVRDGAPVDEVHPFSRVWGLLLDRRLRLRRPK